ncbi:DUF4136 domain-containing protein [Kaarinaea lacus]
MKMRLSYFVLLNIFLWSCAGNKPSVDYDTTADFSTYKTYAWSEKTDNTTSKSMTDSPLVHKRVRESIDENLQAKGLQSADASKADLLVNYHLSVAVTGHSSSSVSFGIGSFGHHSSVGLSVGVPVGGRTIEEGTLLIDIIDAKTNSVVWQGASSRQLSSSPTPEKTKAVVDEVVGEILAGYPPKK